MAVHLRRRHRDPADTRVAPVAGADRAPAERTVVAPARPARRWRHRPNPVSRLLLGLGWAAALILLLGMALTLSGANPGNALVDATLDAGAWLATPFHDLFTRPNPDHQLYLNWGIAAAVYYLLGRALSWLTRF
ncbi:hypothetical protein [Actinomadura kijaniata]|uniref:hypothetical protein n=1 Tax=Actinomadura kijaniata TaxID=46161 RepID=UPI0009FDA897|nr:hypothetical protein [Actinomadura kijaniata]